MKILFVWRQYHGMVGGVERTSIDLMNEMCRRGHQVSLMSWDQSNAQACYPMDPRIDWFKIDFKDSRVKADWKTRLQRLLIIRNFVKKIKPDVILAYMDGIFLATQMAVLGLNIPVIEAERCAPSRFKFLGSPFKTSMIFQSLRMARAITIQVESYRNDYPAYLRQKIHTISNPVTSADAYANPSGHEQGKKILLSVGRLAYQKNYGVLIDAFSKIAPNFPDWNLHIAGDGDERKKLETLISQHGLSERIILLGEVADVLSLYKSAHLFCLPSLWEGFPNALAEALAHALPSVGLENCAGVKDLIVPNKNGLLCTPEKLAATLSSLMQDQQARARMGVVAVQSVQAYQPQKIYDAWEALFTSLNHHGLKR